MFILVRAKHSPSIMKVVKLLLGGWLADSSLPLPYELCHIRDSMLVSATVKLDIQQLAVV